MTQRSSPSWRRRCLAGGLAAAVAMAGVGVAVAGPGGPPEPVAPLAASVDEGLDTVTDAPPTSQVDDTPTTSVPEKDLTALPPVAGGEDDGRPGTVEPAADTTSADSTGAQDSSGSSVPPSTTYTTIDPSRIFGEGGPGGSGRADLEGLAAEIEDQVRTCVADLLDGIESTFEAEPDADRIQSFASGVVEEVLACVAGLVDVGQVLGCVSEVIQEIVAVVMTMDFTDLPDLISEIADDVVSCVSA